MLASLTSPISVFLAWWGEELAGLLKLQVSGPEKSGPRSVIAVNGDELQLEKPIPLTSNSAAGRGMPVKLSAMLDFLGQLAQSKSPPAIALRVPLKSCFMRTVSLPTEAAADFPRLLSLDLERATPFKIKDVYTAHVAVPSANGTKTRQLKQIVVKRSLVDGVRSEIEALGLTVAEIECLHGSGTEALPVTLWSIAPQSRRRPATALTLGAALLLLSLTASYFAVDRYDAALVDLQAKNEALKARAQATRDAMAKSEKSVAAIDSFNHLRRETVSRAAILEEITRVLPDSAWITDLKISAATVDISGLATSASALMPLIEKSPLFVDATSTSPLTFDPRENKERFGIRMRLRAVPVTTDEQGIEAQ